MTVSIPVHLHVVRDHVNKVNLTRYTTEPVAPVPNDQSESKLLGTIIAPAGTEIIARGEGDDAVKFPGDRLVTGLFQAMDHARRGILGLVWQAHWQAEAQGA